MDKHARQQLFTDQEGKTWESLQEKLGDILEGFFARLENTMDDRFMTMSYYFQQMSQSFKQFRKRNPPPKNDSLPGSTLPKVRLMPQNAAMNRAAAATEEPDWLQLAFLTFQHNVSHFFKQQLKSSAAAKKEKMDVNAIMEQERAFEEMQQSGVVPTTHDQLVGMQRRRKGLGSNGTTRSTIAGNESTRRTVQTPGERISLDGLRGGALSSKKGKRKGPPIFFDPEDEIEEPAQKSSVVKQTWWEQKKRDLTRKLKQKLRRVPVVKNWVDSSDARLTGMQFHDFEKVALTVRVLAQLTVAAKTEDRNGVVQKSLAQTIELLLATYTTVSNFTLKFEESPYYMMGHGIVRPQTHAMISIVKSAVYQVITAYHEDLSSMTFKSYHIPRLQSFLDWQE
eukprot:TRINITY_DN2873_c0_g1_i1.p1 TRINITY_DN2873_c0_g1~~TRINITY_DN2873_c0_g1_i1.p1  ORF type:complete len:395 (-),score=95.43 TRINITY_DN2873_c0_g1_i1:111-1295(-)